MHILLLHRVPRLPLLSMAYLAKVSVCVRTCASFFMYPSVHAESDRRDPLVRSFTRTFVVAVTGNSK